MILIRHRVNSIAKLKNTPKNEGVEIDLRSEKKKIYLHHNPFKKGIMFERWIKFFDHKLVVLNVKEEGLEKKIIKILKKKKISNFFFHDQTFSTLIKNMYVTNVSIRVSEFEDLKRKKFLFRKIKWLWVDNFTKIDLNQKLFNLCKKNKIKICIVSPELVKKNRVKEIYQTFKRLSMLKIRPDAICTNKPNVWRKMYNEK